MTKRNRPRTRRLRLVSWNLAGRVKLAPEQAARLAEAQPDVVCLQEVTGGAQALWRHALTSIGLEYQVLPAPPAHQSGARAAHAEPPRRRLSVLTAARRPLAGGPIEGVPWPERALSTRLADGLELVNVHSPISPSADLAKVRTHEAVRAHLIARQGSPCVLCGDLNTPRREHPDGSVWTFARDRNGRLRPDRGERWDRAETGLIRGLEPYGYFDAFRALHGHERREPSWEWPRWGGGYRLDHLIASTQVEVTSCRYAHDWRRAGLSDHSALIAEIGY